MTQLEKLGWTQEWANHFLPHGDLAPGRVIAEHRSGYRVQTETVDCHARISGRLRHESVRSSELPAVGDWVAVSLPTEFGESTIHRVMPRKTKFSRKVAGDRTEEQVVAANVDTVWIVSSLDRDFNLRRIERYLTLAWESGAAPAIVLTKLDLSDDADRCIAEVESISIGTPVHATSSFTGDGLRELAHYLDRHATVALLGSSGVGKSTLINALAGSELQETANVRADGKGRHTTTHRQLLRLPRGGLIIDTPGMRELQLWDGQTGLADTFGDIDTLAAACRFADCCHAGEPGCAVLAAVTRGEVPPERLESYRKLQRELAYLERKQDALALQQEKRQIKSVMKSLRHHPKYRK